MKLMFTRKIRACTAHSACKASCTWKRTNVEQYSAKTRIHHFNTYNVHNVYLQAPFQVRFESIEDMPATRRGHNQGNGQAAVESSNHHTEEHEAMPLVSGTIRVYHIAIANKVATVPKYVHGKLKSQNCIIR